MDANEEQLKITKKRGFIVREIISTEVTYVERLKFAVDVIILPLRENRLLEMNDLTTQFGILEKICSLHCTHSIAEVESNPEKLGEFFHNISDNVQIYTDYLVNYESAMQRRCSLLISNRKFSDFLDKAEKDPRLQNQKIESIFILPVQRIPRYRLLLEQLLKYTPETHPEYTDVKNALDKICDMALYSNEAIRARENRAKIMDIIKTIEPRTRVDLLADPDRAFLKEGPLLRQCRRGLKEFHFWLFNDQLLYGQATPLGLFILNRQIDLTKCYVNACESMHDEGYSFIVESPAKSFIICFAAENEKNEWYEAIHEAILALNKARQSKQKSQFAPLWMPDKVSATCQKCRDAFSLINRRHHCRNCGAIVCDTCSKNRIKLEHVDQRKQVRVCDACCLYLSSSGAKNSIRLNSLRLKAGHDGHTADSHTATAGDDDELYISDLDDEEMAGREGLDEEALNDFNDFVNDQNHVNDFHKQVSLGATNNTFRENTTNLLKGLSGVLSFATSPNRGTATQPPARPAMLTSKSEKITGAHTYHLYADEEDDDVAGSADDGPRRNSSTAASAHKSIPMDVFMPPKPPKPPKPTHSSETASSISSSTSAKNEPERTQSPVPSSPTPTASPAGPRGPPGAGGRPGLMRSVSAFVTSGTTFLTTGSTSSPSTPAATPTTTATPAAAPATPTSNSQTPTVTVNSPLTSPNAARSLPGPPTPPPRPAVEATFTTTTTLSTSTAASPASATATEDAELTGTLESTATTTTTTSTAAPAAGSANLAIEAEGERQEEAAVEEGVLLFTPPAKPPKPRPMSRRTNICITVDELELAEAVAQLQEEEEKKARQAQAQAQEHVQEEALPEKDT